MKRLTIGSCMTKSPHTIGASQTLASASATMRRYRIRHLPVLSRGKLIGVVSARDIQLLQTLRDVDPSTVTVEEAMSPEPFSVSPTASVKHVARVMAKKKLGSAVVVERDTVVGVFTTVDAMRTLETVLATRESVQ